MFIRTMKLQSLIKQLVSVFFHSYCNWFLSNSIIRSYVISLFFIHSSLYLYTMHCFIDVLLIKLFAYFTIQRKLCWLLSHLHILFFINFVGFFLIHLLIKSSIHFCIFLFDNSFVSLFVVHLFICLFVLLCVCSLVACLLMNLCLRLSVIYTCTHTYKCLLYICLLQPLSHYSSDF